MTEPWEWEEPDLQALVNQKASESLELDFKECRALDVSTAKARDKSKFDLSKDVSAFANSAGGTLVYGIIEHKKTHTAAKLDHGYDPAVISKEWIDQVINSNIRPRMSGIRINSVELMSSNPGRAAYVVYTPQSSTAHQAVDKRYYKRFNFESVPMEDYEIRDVMQRSAGPRLSVDVEIPGERGYMAVQRREDGFQFPPIGLFAWNAEEAGVCEFSQYQVFLPSDLEVIAEAVIVERGQLVRSRLSFMPSETGLFVTSVRPFAFSYFETRWTPDALPLFPGERRQFARVGVRIPAPAMRRNMHFLLWRVRASRSPATTGAVVFREESDAGWSYGPVSIQGLEDQGFMAQFAP